jgi:hypothetical protein
MRGAQESILIFPQNCLDNGGHHNFVRDTTTILIKFVDGADRLIESALLENGWIVRAVDGDSDANA